MLKQTLVTLLIILSGNLFSQEMAVSQKTPPVFEPGETYTIETKISRGNYSGFMRFAQEIPEGFIATQVENKNGSFTFSENTIKIVWLSPPNEQEFTIQYKLSVPSTAKGTIQLTGKLSYVMDNERKMTELAPKEITIGKKEAVVVAKTPEPVKTAPPPPAPVETKQPTKTEPAKQPTEEPKPVAETKKQPVETTTKKEVTTTPSTTVKTPVTAAPSSTGITYRVQIGAYTQNPTITGVPELSKVSFEGGLTKYYSGNFSNYEDASARRKVMIEKGFNGAFIVKFENGKVVK